jgi:hypothetical protein
MSAFVNASLPLVRAWFCSSQSVSPFWSLWLKRKQQHTGHRHFVACSLWFSDFLILFGNRSLQNIEQYWSSKLQNVVVLSIKKSDASVETEGYIV